MQNEGVKELQNRRLIPPIMAIPMYMRLNCPGRSWEIWEVGGGTRTTSKNLGDRYDLINGICEEGASYITYNYVHLVPREIRTKTII